MHDEACAGAGMVRVLRHCAGLHQPAWRAEVLMVICMSQLQWC